MASKHSKSFFDFKRDPLVTSNDKTVKRPLSLPIKIIVSLLVVSLVFSSFFLGRFFLQGYSHKKMQEKARSTFSASQSEKSLKQLAEQNKDIIGWIKISDTEINDAVCQGEDDEFYKNHNQLGKKSRYGALYLSSKDSFNRNEQDLNVTIFGNNMKDDTMFGSLQEYCNLRYYKQHPTIDLYYSDTHESYAVFAVLLLSEGNNEGYVVDKNSFADQIDFDSWYAETLKRSFLHTGVNVQYGDEFLTLITSANDFDGAHLAVVAKKTTELDGEIDLITATANSNIKQPKAWYNERGLTYPY